MTDSDGKKKTIGKPKKTGAVVHQQISNNNVRLLFYGGARKIGDNGAFHHAANNVMKDYLKHFPSDKTSSKFVDSAKTIVDTINSQKAGSIASLDLFFHGSKWGLYMYKGASENKTLSLKDISDKNLNAGLYGGEITGLSSTDTHEEKRTINDIHYDRFKKKDAVIEIHGCESGGDLYVINSISKNLSEYLQDGYVIGHITEANPNINNTTKEDEQDYRHGKRAIWLNGEVIKETTKQGFLSLEDLKK